MPTVVPEHVVPAGPLAVRWLEYDLPPPRAGDVGAGWVELQNAGIAAWRKRRSGRFYLGYHWLDLLGNPIVWDGLCGPLPAVVEPGERLRVDARVRGPIPPGRYRLALDVLNEDRLWLSHVGNAMLELDVAVRPRIDRRSLHVEVAEGPEDLVAATRAALAAQEEGLADEGEEAEAVAFVAPGCEPLPDWSRRLLDAHAEGYVAVAGSVEVRGGALERRRAPRELSAWAPGFGRAPAWSNPLVCPSILARYTARVGWTDIGGLPAFDPARMHEPWLCDGRIRVIVSARALRRGSRPRG